MSTPEFIYIITGGYSDWESFASWIVAAYLDEGAANLHAQQAQKYAATVLKRYKRAYKRWLNGATNDEPPDIADYACDLDRGIQSDGRSEIYYRVTPVPIGTELPVIKGKKP